MSVEEIIIGFCISLAAGGLLWFLTRPKEGDSKTIKIKQKNATNMAAGENVTQININTHEDK